MINLQDKLLEKSKEAFISALELYNKPTIKYRVEGFSFFICNAWELMLKAYLIKNKGENSIYYKDKQHRTLSLESCIKKIMTNSNDPVRINLEKIIELRNLSTHFITEEYEIIYAPLFQSSVRNFTNKLLDYFDDDITKLISQNFLTLSMSMSNFDDIEIQARYSPEIANKLIKVNANILNTMQKCSNDKFSITIVHDYRIVKDHKKATATIAIDNSSADVVKIIKEIKDPNNTHPLTAKKCIETINREISKRKILFESQSSQQKTTNIFNMYHFNLIVSYYDLKQDEKYCYMHQIGNNSQFTYSNSIINFILEEIKKDPQNLIKNLKEIIKKQQKKR